MFSNALARNLSESLVATKKEKKSVVFSEPMPRFRGIDKQHSEISL